MKRVFKILSVVLLLITMLFLLQVVREWNYQFDQHGYYTGADGVIHRESLAERNQFLLSVSVILLFFTAFYGFRNPKVRYETK